MRRLPIIEGSSFAGHQIKREQEFNFILNDMKINFFAGDSVLSALLAANIFSAGHHHGFPIALDQYISLPTILNHQDGSINFITSIARMPAINNANYIIKGFEKSSNFSTRLANLIKPKKNSLNIDFNRYSNWEFDFLGKQKHKIAVELLIVGAGIAGLNAAQYGASLDKNILLVERRNWLGGDAILFGNKADEEHPDITITRLTKAIKKAKNIKTIINSEVISIDNNIAIVQQIYLYKGKAYEKILEVTAKKIILATGCADRLPVFHGNRLSNVLGLGAIFNLASAYGVFPSGSSAIISNNNIAYRLALLASDAGAKIEKIFDNRIEANSRFIEFAKSYGIKFETGLEPTKITLAPSNQLDLSMKLTWENSVSKCKTYTFNAIILSYGWLPRLSLWHQAKGKIIPLNDANGIQAEGELSDIILAGSNMDLKSNDSVLQSAIEAVHYLFEKNRTKIVDKTIEPAFETPMGEIIANKDNLLDAAPKYYDFGTSLICETGSKKQTGFFRNTANKEHNKNQLLTKKAFSLGDINSLNYLSSLTEYQFQTILKQRVIVDKNIHKIALVKDTKQANQNDNNINIPDYFKDRFGKNIMKWAIMSLDGSKVEIGQLIFANSDIFVAEKALGAIIAQSDNSMIAIISKDKSHPNLQVSIIGSRGHFPAKLIKITK